MSSSLDNNVYLRHLKLRYFILKQCQFQLKRLWYLIIRNSRLCTLRTIKKVTAVLKDISGEKYDLSIFFLFEMERVSSNEANVTNPMSFHQLF